MFGTDYWSAYKYNYNPENILNWKEPEVMTEKDGKPVLKTNLYTKLKNFKDRIITSDLLGNAFEPEQRFENPDGTEIIFNRDYFGNPRGLDTIPGPFAEAEDSTKPLW